MDYEIFKENLVDVIELKRIKQFFRYKIFKKKYLDLDLELFFTVIEKMNKEAIKNNSNFIFVYVPSSFRYFIEKKKISPEIGYQMNQKEIILENLKELGIFTIDLTEFFTGVQDSLEYEINVSQDAFPDNVDRVDVMIDDQNIMIESNKLSAIRHIVSKFMESGYLISRDIDTEKMFKKDKLTRYMRIFKIISRGSTICLN